MTTLTWPTLSRPASRQEWSLQSMTQLHISPLNGAMQTQSLPGSRWTTAITYDGVYLVQDQQLLQRLIMQLRGRAGRVAVPNQGWIRRGTGGGTPLVAGAGQTGTTLNTDGWTSGSQVAIGDYFQVGVEMKFITAAATANSSGVMTIQFEPPLRQSPADNAAINYTTPTVVMQPLDDLGVWEYNSPRVMTFVFNMQEAVA